MKTVNINIDYNSEDSIKLAEYNKDKLENKGYKVVNTFGGMRHSIIVMGKEYTNKSIINHNGIV